VSYPAFDGPRLGLRQALAAGGGPVAGRLEGRPDCGALRDASTSVPLRWDAGLARPGDLVAGRLVLQPAGNRLEDLRVLAPCSRDSRPPGRAELDELRWRALRARVLAGLRAFFADREFVEVSTSVRVVCPGLEPHLRALGVRGRAPEAWLRTSPELALKRLLSRGMERIYELARVFREEEAGPWHLPEFDLLEWYRAYQGLDAIAEDLEQMLPAVARHLGSEPDQAVAGVDLSPPFERVSVREAMQRHAGLDPADLSEAASLRAALARRGHPTAEDDAWDTLFFRVWTAEVEPRLGIERPTLVFDYPASQAALARIRPDPVWSVAERFELYLKGVELANAFHELNDPLEQRRRHQADRAARRQLGAEVYPLDEDFLAALEAGMPPSAGIALGVDRLVALLAGTDGVKGL
jgi:lysyl-tRNA synthetase class 2